MPPAPAKRTGPKLAALTFLAVVSISCVPRARTVPEGPGDNDFRSAIRALQAVHGPPQEYGDLASLLSPPIEHDFNGDGQKETLFLISDQGPGDLGARSVEDLRKGVTVAGFFLFTRVEGRWWPVYYYFDQERDSLHLDAIYGPYFEDEKAKRIWSEGLVVNSDRQGQELTWFWHPAYPDLPYSFWATSLRRWNEDLQAYAGLRHGGPGPILVNCWGK